MMDLKKIRAEKARRSLRDFIRESWPIIEPVTPYIDNWHIHAMCDYLEAVTLGQIKRLIINVPPRYMKSIAVTIMWPVWEWIEHPGTRWMFASYNGDLSRDHSVSRRTIIQSDWYRANWGSRFELTGDQNVKTEYRNTQQGVMLATSMGGTAIGKGANRIVVDDPHNPQQIESEQILQSQVRFFDQSLYTRLNNKKKDAIVVVMQRLHQNDLCGHLLDDEKDEADKYEHLCLEAECETRRTISTPSGKVFDRKPGELLWLEREGPKEIAGAKKRLGTYGYAGQYQQRPSPAGGGKFKSEWIRYYRVVGEFYQLIDREGNTKAVRIANCDRFATMDVAGTKKKKQKSHKPDYTVIGVWDLTPCHNMVKVDHYRGQIETPQVADKGIEMMRKHDLPWIGVERDGIGLGVVQTMRSRGVTVRAIKAKGSKEARSQTAEIRMEAGMIYFPVGAPWLFDLESELTTFPNAEHDDQVDELSYAALHVQRVRGAPTGEGDDDWQKAKDEEERKEQEQEAQDESVHPFCREPKSEPGDGESMWADYDEDD